MGFKAKTFLGIFSIRNGCLVACFLQAALGVLVWAALRYLRPMLQIFNALTMAYFIFGAALGLYGVWTRSELLTWLYLIHLGSCATIVLLLSMDFAGVLRILPKPPMSPTVPIVPPIVTKLGDLEKAIGEKVSNALPALPNIGSGESPPATQHTSFVNLNRITRHVNLLPSTDHRGRDPRDLLELNQNYIQLSIPTTRNSLVAFTR